MALQTNAPAAKGRKAAPPYDPLADIVRPRHLRQATGLSPTSVWRYRRMGRFPEPLRLGDGAVGWRRSDIDAWLSSRARTGE